MQDPIWHGPQGCGHVSAWLLVLVLVFEVTMRSRALIGALAAAGLLVSHACRAIFFASGMPSRKFWRPGLRAKIGEAIA